MWLYNAIISKTFLIMLHLNREYFVLKLWKLDKETHLSCNTHIHISLLHFQLFKKGYQRCISCFWIRSSTQSICVAFYSKAHEEYPRSGGRYLFKSWRFKQKNISKQRHNFEATLEKVTSKRNQKLWQKCALYCNDSNQTYIQSCLRRMQIIRLNFPTDLK